MAHPIEVKVPLFAFRLEVVTPDDRKLAVVMYAEPDDPEQVIDYTLREMSSRVTEELKNEGYLK